MAKVQVTGNAASGTVAANLLIASVVVRVKLLNLPVMALILSVAILVIRLPLCSNVQGKLSLHSCLLFLCPAPLLTPLASDVQTTLRVILR
jgi:hypothetical protein